MSDEGFVEWIEKYRPDRIQDMIVSDNIKNMFYSYMEKGKVPNICLYGNPGIGKTCLAKTLANEMNAVTLFVCASEESSVDTVRGKIKKFAQSKSIDNRPKIAILDEADGMGQSQQAQNVLRNVISQYTDTTFILTCNNIRAIMDAIESRCTPLYVNYEIKDVAERVFDILKKEEINLDKEDKKEVMRTIKDYYPDIRKILNNVEKNTITGKYSDTGGSKSKEIENVVKEIDSRLKEPRKAREYYIKNSPVFNSDYIGLMRGFMDYLEDPVEQLIAGMFDYRVENTIDAEIQFYTFCLMLFNYRQNNINPVKIMEFK